MSQQAVGKAHVAVDAEVIQQNGRVPGTLAELRTLVDSVDDGEDSLEFRWLQWAYNYLTARKVYHKKQQLKRRMMLKVASEQLSPDELARIDEQAEDLAEKEVG